MERWSHLEFSRRRWVSAPPSSWSAFGLEDVEMHTGFFHRDNPRQERMTSLAKTTVTIDRHPLHCHPVHHELPWNTPRCDLFLLWSFSARTGRADHRNIAAFLCSLNLVFHKDTFYNVPNFAVAVLLLTAAWANVMSSLSYWKTFISWNFKTFINISWWASMSMSPRMWNC